MSTPISYVTLTEKVTAAYERTSAAHPHHTVTQYTSFGGGDGVSRWQTVGFYARTSPDARLVYEAFHDEQRSAAVIRVFGEGVGEPLFARKWAGDDARFWDTVESAADIFEGALPATPYQEEPADDMSWLPLSDEERAALARALVPFPPPFSLAATQDA